MRKRSASKLPLFFLPAAVFFCPSLACVQQQSDSVHSAPYASVAESTSVAAESRLQQSTGSSANLRDAMLAPAMGTGSAWNAGAAALKQGVAGASVAAKGSFNAGGASWIAGRNAFSLEPQRGGIWHAQPSVISQATAAPSAVLAPDLAVAPTAGSPNATLSGEKRSSSQSARRTGRASHGFTAGSHGPNFPSRGRTSLAYPYTPHYSSLGTGQGTSLGNSTTPSPEPLALPALNDTLDSGSTPQ